MINIDVLKENVDIEALLSYYKLEFKRTGNSLQLLCPFHDEKNPSFFFDLEKKVFHCFGCGVGGDVIKFVQLLEKKDFRETVEFLIHFVGSEPDFRIQREKRDVFWSSDFLPVSSELFPSYLKERNVSLETARTFRLHVCFKGKYLNRVIVPVYFRNRLIGFIARSMNGSEPSYLNEGNVKRFLFNYDIAKEFPNVFVVEGVFDLFRVFQSGFKNVVATFGKRTTAEQKIFLAKFEKLFLIPDNDNSSESLFTELKDFDVEVVKLPQKVKDVAELNEEEVKRIVLERVPKFPKIKEVSVRR